jgi:DNA-binding transcriptional LysR family regulator
MTIQQAEICTRLALLGSVNAVAKSLGITQPAISSALSVLEKELGITLFIRSKKGVVPTRKGSELLPHFKSIVQATGQVLSTAAILPQDKGTITIAGRQGFMQYVFPHLYQALNQKYPLIKVERLISGNQEEVIESLMSGQADICFAPSPKIKSLSAEILFRDPVYICVSRSHPAIIGNRFQPHQLQKLEFCLPTKDDRLRKPLEKLIHSHIKSPHIGIETNDYTLIAKLVATKNFAGPIYHHVLLADEIKREVLPIGIFKPVIFRDLTVLYRRDDLLPHIRTAKDFFRWEVSKILNHHIKQI